MAAKTKGSKSGRAGWKARGSAPLQWEEGLEVEGKFIRLQPKDEETGAIVTLEMVAPETGEVERIRYWAPTILANRLQDDFQPGEDVLIVCHGKNVPSKRGQNAWGFDVYGRD
jgi:hypothetical protein